MKFIFISIVYRKYVTRCIKMNKEELISCLKNEKSFVEFFNMKCLILEYLENQDNLLGGE